MTNDGVIGNRGRLPWNLSEELRYFREITSGKTVVMGRRTFESIGHPLLNRRNIVLSTSGFTHPGCKSISSIDEVLKIDNLEEEIMIIGGSSTYAAFLPMATQLYVTRIHKTYAGDAFFPDIIWAEWDLVKEDIRDDFTTQLWLRLPTLHYNRTDHYNDKHNDENNNHD